MNSPYLWSMTSPPPNWSHVDAVNISWNANGVNIGQDEGVSRPNVQRDSYHHGDLTNALTAAATQLARTGGPGAVVLREAARQVGVSATAAYRHFAGHGELMHAVKDQAQAQLARKMREELAALPAERDYARDAVRRLRALGAGYIRFALAEPGLFRTAFCHLEFKSAQDASIDDAPSYALLGEVLDELVASGAMPASRRPGAPIAAWSAVHGLSLLLLDGPLADIPPDQLEPLIGATVDMVVAGLCAPTAADPLPNASGH
jgi:AcrR family transcriptional regulator